MREYYFPYSLKGVGLRKDYRNPLDSPGLIECMNAKPTEFGVVGIEDVVNPLSDAMTVEDIDIDWPYPQLYLGVRYWLLLTRSAVYTVNTDWSIVLAANIPEVSQTDYGWSVADFDSYLLVTNRSYVVTILDDVFAFALPTGMSTVPYSMSKYKGRLVTGGPGNNIAWSDIGHASMTPDRKNEAGYRPTPWGGNVTIVKELGDLIMAYGSGGITAYKAVSSPAPTLAMKEIENGFGISGSAVAGDEKVHYYIDEVGELWSITSELQRRKLGYKEFFEPMLGSIISASYDSQQGEAYFSNGEHSYIVTPSGLGATNQMITSLAISGGSLIGIFSLGDNFDFTVTPDAFDLGTRSIKGFQVIEVHGSMPYETYCAVEWRNNKKKGFRSTVPKRLNEEGIAYPGVEGVEFRPVISSNFWEGMRLEELGVRWKATDRRSVRGMGRANQTSR